VRGRKGGKGGAEKGGGEVEREGVDVARPDL